MAANLHIRGIHPKVMAQIKAKALAQDMSINSFVLLLLEENLGLSAPKRSRAYHDLDSLAGTWDDKQAKDFKKACSNFEEIDEGLWK